MLICHSSPRVSGNDAVLVPPKLSSELNGYTVYLLRTVLDVVGLHHFQSHSENCGIMAHIVTILGHSGPLD